MLLMGAPLLAGALLLAFTNGANDNVKGVATLYGSGALLSVELRRGWRAAPAELSRRP